MTVHVVVMKIEMDSSDIEILGVFSSEDDAIKCQKHEENNAVNNSYRIEIYEQKVLDEYDDGEPKPLEMEIDGHEIRHNNKFARFIKEMEEQGEKVYFYKGRNYYEGPAVNCEDVSDIMSRTSVKCQYDSKGLEWIVYPKGY
jgi:hypothetical protein